MNYISSDFVHVWNKEATSAEVCTFPDSKFARCLLSCKVAAHQHKLGYQSGFTSHGWDSLHFCNVLIFKQTIVVGKLAT